MKLKKLKLPTLTGVSMTAAFMLFLVAGMGFVSAAAPKAPITPTTPTKVTAKPGVASVTVSWHATHKTDETFTVTSVPSGKGCVVVGATSCTIPVTDSTPWRYQVSASVGSLSTAQSALTAVVPHRTIVILAGQSNATGAASFAVDPTTKINYLAAPYTNGADKTSTISWMPWLVNPEKSKSKTGQVALDTPQIESDSNGNPVQIFGPEIGWARQIYTDTGQPVSVVKAAFPNTNLANNWSPTAPGGAFSQMVAKVELTMADDAQKGQLDTIGAVAWYQGESDASDPTMAAAYQANLSAFIIALRSDLPADPTTPIVLVKESMADVVSVWEAFDMCGTPNLCTSVTTGDNEVRSADDWASANLPDVDEVDSVGLPRYQGLIHLTNTSQLTIGQEIATASDRSMP